uniref:Uncharacterized protein n=1 Tax=Octopus bimaculoides TaxID=37653 RepID=A0A0L8GPR9_OCTBM
MEELLASVTELQKQQQQQLQQQQLVELQKQQQLLIQLLLNHTITLLIPDMVANPIGEFTCNPDEGITFPVYYRRHLSSIAVFILDVLNSMENDDDDDDSGGAAAAGAGWNKTRVVFETIFLSENTKVLVESIFWWIYLDLLEPTMHQSKELLFSRMAEKYVAMLMSIPTGYNDVILNKIPKALSQATYVAFFDGLRTHHQYFDDNFKQYIFSYITKWTTGITPQPGAGNKEREKMAKLTGERTETIAEMLTHSILSNKPVKLDLTMQDLEDLQKHQENKSLFKVSPMKEVPRLSVTKDTPKQKETCEPEVAVDNLHLEKVKFDLYSQCPLVNYCMYNRKMSAIYMIPSNQIIQRLQRTEKTYPFF